MTNNQREFQKEVARLQRSINKLLQDPTYQQTVSLPEQPKKITRGYLSDLKQYKGKDFTQQIELPSAPTPTTDIDEHHKRLVPFEEVYIRHPRVADYEKQRAHRNAYQRRRRAELKQKKLNEQANKTAQQIDTPQIESEVSADYIPTFSRFNTILDEFNKGIRDCMSATMFVKHSIANPKLDVLIRGKQEFINLHNEDPEGYEEYLSIHEEAIAKAIWKVVYSSTQEQLDDATNELFLELGIGYVITDYDNEYDLPIME